MTAIDHPKTANEITRDWIGFALEEAGICKNSQVIAIDVKPLGGDVSGFLSSICRVNLSYDSLGPGLPASYVIKFPPAEDINRKFAQTFRANERELLFYRQIAPGAPLRIPKCYYSVMEEETGNYVLVLEDEKDWKTGNQVEGLSRKQVETAIREIAKLHAQWWDSPKLKRLDWMPHQNRDIKSSFAENWPEFSEEHRDILSERDIKAGDLISQSGEKIQELIHSDPMTIAHTDFRADNLMFMGEDKVLVLDWQVACRMTGAFDVARVVCGSLKEEITYEDHLGLVDMWYDELVREGVSDYTLGEAWRDYRSALIYCSYVPVTAHHLISHEGSRGVPLLKAMITRMFRAIHECRALELLK